MLDPKLFAVLTAYDKSNLAREAFGLSENVYCYCKTTEGIAHEAIIDSREPTPAPQSPPNANYESGDRILLRLDDPLKDPKTGWQFGTNPRVCDVLLGHRGTGGISSRQFYITITEQFRVELHDESRYGTVISHNGQAKDTVLKNDKRLLSFEPGAHQQWKEIIVYVPDDKGLAFKIEFPKHSEGGHEYWKNLRAFVEECRTALPTVSGLGLDSNPPTAPISRQPRTPQRLPVYYDGGEIGRGEFGLVRKLIDLRGEKIYAVKEFNPKAPTRPSGKKRKLDEIGWLEGVRNEVDNMKNHPHPNIMRVIDFKEKPEPSLWMPYYPHGNLEDRTDVKPWQYVSAFRQMLLGLRHLHGRGVVHRDLKPANLLIAEIDPFTIVISDFGFSRFVISDNLLKTFCGSKAYTAPEVVPVGNKLCSQGYRSSVDIWSVGMIMMDFLFGRANHADIDHLPLKNWILEWSDKAVKQVYELDENNDQVIDIVKHMVTKKPKDRFSAARCLQRGCDNGLFKRRSDGEIINADDRLGDNTVEVDTEAETEIAAMDTDVSDEMSSVDRISDDGVATPAQPRQRTGSGTSNVEASILAGELWGSDKSGRQESADSLSGQLTPTRGSNSGPATRRLKMSHTSSWSLTIGPGHSDTDGEFDLDGGGYDRDGQPATGVYIRKDHFTASLDSQFDVGNKSSSANESQVEDEAGGVRQESLALPESEPEISQPLVTDSFVAYILQTQA
ncbi:hypothetical protein OEA41_001265 [Lepraria neglecta]|uniref:Protein kinase domain-containing protein n=1 Tax=Lepraria neglecta TaxID=209136 RepID=A0AAD9Z9H0_9LECA|nr:hypothetical protein OEA41_001265 [Lepraria neglecta]